MIKHYIITENRTSYVDGYGIEARFDSLNLNSGKVMIKCGMRYEGTMRKADRNNQGICDSVMYALIAEDYIN